MQFNNGEDINNNLEGDFGVNNIQLENSAKGEFGAINSGQSQVNLNELTNKENKKDANNVASKVMHWAYAPSPRGVPGSIPGCTASALSKKYYKQELKQCFEKIIKLILNFIRK